jgi:hypothetical protein
MQNPQGIRQGIHGLGHVRRSMGGLGDGPAPVPSNTAATVGKVLLVGVAAGALYALFKKKK